MPQTQTYAGKPLPLEIQEVTGMKYVVEKVLFNTAKNGKPYTRIEMKDTRKKNVTGVIFDKWKKEIKEGDIVTVSGTLKKFRKGKYSIDIKEITPAQVITPNMQTSKPQETKNDPAPAQNNKNTDSNAQENTIKIECKKIIDFIQDPNLHKFVMDTLTKHKEFFTAPGGKMYHDTHPGGLAEHSCRVARIALAIAKELSANIDLVIAGAVLHDIGKIAYNKNLSTKAEEINAISEKILVEQAAEAHLNPETLNNLIRIALSHQETKDNGAYFNPKSLEEKIVAVANTLDILKQQTEKR